ncbi:MAG: hypothetical protein ACPGTO_07510 [Polaribacter sp.]
MKVLKLLLDFYINASIHVAFAVYSLVRITEIYFNLPYNEILNYFIFFASITGYNFVKYAGVAKFHHRSLTDNLKIIQVFSFFCFLGMCFYAHQLPLKMLLYFTPFGLLTILYAIPFLSGFQKNLRAISYLKIIIVATVWAGITVLLPILDADKIITLEVVLYSIQRFLIVVVLILPFDIRDVKYDAISLHTIPQKIGIPKTKKLGLTLMLFALVIEFMISPSIPIKNGFLVFFFIIIIFLMRSKIAQPNYYSSFWVEAIPVFWWILLLGICDFL